MKEFLPIGTVVLLKEATKKVMIVGYLPVTSDNKTFDYSGVMWPEGSLSSDQTLLFNNEDIDQKFFDGYKDEEQTLFFNKINDLIIANEKIDIQ